MASDFYSIKVKEVKRETIDTVSIFFDIPENLKDTFSYKQGQYITVKVPIRGKEERRAYSMCSSPLEKDIAIAVKQVQDGKVSTYLNQELKSGDHIEMMKPEGRFFTELSLENRKTYYFFGAGSGITPLYSIIKTILEEEPQSSVFLLYGNRNEDSIIFKAGLNQLIERYKGQLFVEYILSKPHREKVKGLTGIFKKGKINWPGKVGRINNLIVSKYLKENPPPYPTVEYFICGPGDMIDLVETELIKQGIEEKKIHTERFVNAHDIKQTVSGVNGAKATIMLDGRKIETIIPSNKTILDVLIDQKYDPPYSCTSGACSTCMAKVTKGSIKMDACFALDDDEIEEGYILTCQSHPTSEEVEITFDI